MEISVIKYMAKLKGFAKHITNLRNKTPKVKPELKFLDSLKPPKTDVELKLKIDNIKDKSLKKRILTSKLLWGGGIATGITAAYLDLYKTSNTGCFLESKDNSCKIVELSCCNVRVNPYVKACGGEIIKRLNIDKKTCMNYDFNDTNCCRKCDCKYYPCAPDETMTCHRATVGEALTYFTDTIATTVGDTIHDILTSSIVIKTFAVVFIILIIGLVVYKLL